MEDPEAWRAGELLAGITWLNAKSTDSFIPQMLGFENIGAVSFQKGCYPGQEIVARARYLDPQQETESKVIKKTLVIGGGVAGIQASLDLADAGIDVVLVEKSSTIGGVMAQLNKTFPTMDCSI